MSTVRTDNAVVADSELSFETLLDAYLTDEVLEIAMAAEESGLFPRDLIERMGAAGILRSKWSAGMNPDLAKLNALAMALGRLGSGGVGPGLSIHDSAIAILRRFGGNPYLTELTERAIDGEIVLCLAASEQAGGSDLQHVETVAHRTGDGFHLVGRKKFVSLAPVADHTLVVARVVDEGGAAAQRAGGNVAVFAVPMSQVSVGTAYRKIGASALSTAPIEFDTTVGPDHLVARAGVGLLAISWGLAHERLSVAGQIAGSCELAIAVTHARMIERTQFGQRLFQHQALRLRLADLSARVHMLKLALTGMAATQSNLDIRTSAGIKVIAARLGEEVTSECMHIFGGSGYLVDETPVGRWWQDMKLARTAGGSDEVLLELVASGMKPDHDTYSKIIRSEVGNRQS
ncbi:acyl-CoA dehydrogenase family protein [Nocardia sp. NPDC004340]